MFWTIPPLSAATAGPWITPRGCQPKKRQEGLLVFQAKTVCSQRWNPDSERVGVHQQTAYFIHRVAINFFVFRGTTPTSLWFVCPRYYLGWVAVKMFGFKKGLKNDWCGGEKKVEALQSLSGLGAGSNSITKKNTHTHTHIHVGLNACMPVCVCVKWLPLLPGFGLPGLPLSSLLYFSPSFSLPAPGVWLSAL